ncbi:hypothetical protein [Ensifer aridi]|uniref:hypothetical protein n=1 Tax=Ensifer aridi TaxID=1708715 RepID=UPI000A0FF8AE|nr:hypothetical protein [Ensifer aridi]
MPEDKTSAIDIDKVVAALEKMAETPNTAAMTYRQQLREPRMLGAIRKCQAAGWKTDDIAKLLNEQGLQIKTSTLIAYLREIEAETRSEGEGKPGVKPRRNSAKAAAATSTAKPETSPATTSKTPPASEEKKSTQKPKMGGAHSPEDL